MNKIIRPYISLETPILPKEKLYPTPSMNDGLSYEDEFDLRVIGCELIQTSGRLLKLPQTAMATGQIIFHRYFYSKSFVKNNMEYYAMASIYLSSKIEESPRTIRDIINVFNNIKQVRTGKLIKPVPIDHAYYELKNQIIKAERRILKELGFCVHVKHPHKVILIYLNAMKCDGNVDLIQKAWNYMNDSLRLDVFLRYTPETVACACIYLSARELQIPLPNNPYWFLVFGAQEEALKAISIRLVHLYNHKTKTQDELEKIVNQCRDNINKEKLRNRVMIKETTEAQTSETIVLDEIKTASTTPSSDIAVAVNAPASTTSNNSAIATTTTNSSSTTITNKINIINSTNINITNNTSHNGHHHHHHHGSYRHNDEYQHQQQQQPVPHHHHSKHQSYHHHHNSYLYQQQSGGYHPYATNNYSSSYPYHVPYDYYGGEYIEAGDDEYYKSYHHADVSNGVKRKESKSSHKKHSKHKTRSRSRSSRSTSEPSPKYKKHKRRNSKDRHRSRSRSQSPASKHKKKKYHHKSRSRDHDNGIMVQDVRLH